MSIPRINLQGVSMVEQLCWAFFHGQLACEAAFNGHSLNCKVTVAAAGDDKAALSSEGCCQACSQFKEEASASLREQEAKPDPEVKCDDETITDDTFNVPLLPVRGMELNDSVTITSESNTAKRRNSDRSARKSY